LSGAVWGVAALFYLMAFYVRASPAVMTSELMRDFGITAASLGTFSACYFYAYLVMQVPTGVLVDSWGARRLLVAGSIAAAAGTALFAIAPNLTIASVGRGLVGAATAVGWVVTLKLATHWFPRQQFALLSGLGLFVGNIGNLVAQVPLRLLVDSLGWRNVTWITAIILLLLGALAWAFVRDDPADAGFTSYAPAAVQDRGRQTTWAERLKGFAHIFAYRNIWLIFLAQGGLVGSVLAFTGLWGPPFLKVRYGLPSTTAAAVCSVMIVCWAIASPLFGYLSDRLGRRKPLYFGGTILSTLGWAVLFYLPGLPLAAFLIVGAVTCLAGGAVILGFAYAKESVPVQYLGTISGTINMGNMLGPTLLQPGIGWVLDRQWAGGSANGLRLYDLGAFQAGFALILGWLALSCLLIALTRDTHCIQRA
jgi:sugar phosphate permease